MRYLRTAMLSILAVSSFAVADDTGVVRDHEIGRVFMTSAERRQLDLLRKSRPASDRPGPASAMATADAVVQKKRLNPVGYILSPRGSPYQWINGDFRHVEKAAVDATDVSRSIEITRHDNENFRDDYAPGDQNPASPDDDEELNAEAENANRTQR